MQGQCTNYRINFEQIKNKIKITIGEYISVTCYLSINCNIYAPEKTKTKHNLFQLINMIQKQASHSTEIWHLSL